MTPGPPLCMIALCAMTGSHCSASFDRQQVTSSDLRFSELRSYDHPAETQWGHRSRVSLRITMTSHERHGISNHRQLYYLFKRLLRLHKNTGLCEGWPVDSPHKRPVTRKPLPCDDLIMRVRTLERVSWVEIIAKLCFAKNNSGFIPRKQTHLCQSYLSKISHSLQRRLKPVHWNGNLVMLTKFSSLATPNFVIWQLSLQPMMKISYTETEISFWQIFVYGCTKSCLLTTSNAASDEHFVKMTTFPFSLIVWGYTSQQRNHRSIALWTRCGETLWTLDQSLISLHHNVVRGVGGGQIYLVNKCFRWEKGNIHYVNIGYVKPIKNWG